MSFLSKMLTRATERVSYKSLNTFSTATEWEIIMNEERRLRRRRDIYEAERILAEKKVKLLVLLLRQHYLVSLVDMYMLVQTCSGVQYCLSRSIRTVFFLFFLLGG